MTNMLIYFISGGFFTTLIVVLDQSGSRLLSGFLALMPVFTLISYIFIGQTGGGLAVSQNAKFVLYGTFVSWVPYMITVIILAPKFGAYKAIGLGMAVFFLLASLYLLVVFKLGLFQ